MKASSQVLLFTGGLSLIIVSLTRPWETSGQTPTPTFEPSPDSTASPAPSPTQSTGLTEISPTGQLCHGDARVRVDKGDGEEDSAPVIEVMAVAPGFQVAVGDIVYALPPGPFPEEASFLIFRDDAGRLQFGFRSCEGNSPVALPDTGGWPSGSPSN